MPEIDILATAKRIRLLVLDVDGVMTDGKLSYGADGREIKSFNTQDGHGVKMLRRSGIAVGIITGRTSEAVARRAGELGIDLLIQGREDKFEALGEMLQTFPCALADIAFMGDDWPDLSVMTRVGLALTVANAHPEVLERAAWVADANGGEGAVRQACDLLLKAQGKYRAALDAYTNADA